MIAIEQTKQSISRIEKKETGAKRKRVINGRTQSIQQRKIKKNEPTKNDYILVGPTCHVFFTKISVNIVNSLAIFVIVSPVLN